MLEKRKVIAFGAGCFFDENIMWLKEKYDVLYVCDNDGQKWNNTYKGVECISPSELYEYKDIDVVLTVGKQMVERQILDQLNQHDVSVIDIYDYLTNENKAEFFGGDVQHMCIWGTIQECRYIDKIISNMCTDVVIDSYITHTINKIGEDAITGKKIISLHKAESMLREKEIDGIIAVAFAMPFNVVTRRYISPDILNGDSYYVVPKGIMRSFAGTSKEVQSIFTLYRDTYQTGSVQFLITQKCNLNCKLCSHFAPLVRNCDFYDLEQFKKDIRKVAELFNDVDEIGLWGGETLLCPFLEEYVYEARKCFPYSRIVIGTNGLLLNKISDKLIEAIKTTNAMFAISLYPPTLNYIDDIKNFLDLHRISARYPGTTKIERFFRRYDLKGKNDIEKSYKYCESKYCSTVLNGKIAACYFPLIANVFNEYYVEKLEKGFDTEMDVVDLHDEQLTRKKLIEYLRKPLQSCRYCGEVKLEEWSVSRRETSVEDWVL